MILNKIEDETLANARANQADPWVLYLIVRESLGMSAGKTAAQVAHATAMVYIDHRRACRSKASWLRKLLFFSLSPKDKDFLERFSNWENDSFRKVVLRANDEQWEQLQKEHDCYLVRDAGLTEVEPGSETVIALRPIRKSERSELLFSLKSLK